jgi:hypothetical protein
MTNLDDDRMDQRLRRAGERLRHEAPSGDATFDALEALSVRPLPPRRAARWVAPLVVAAVAASVVGLLLLVGSRDEAVEEPPADQPSTTAGEVSAHLYAQDFDGAGGHCVSLVGQDGAPTQGCLAGDQKQLGRAVVTAVDGDLRTIVSPGLTTVHGQEDPSCFGDLADAHGGRFVDIVTCGGGQPVFGLLPVEPGEETEWFVRSVTGRDVAIELVGDDGVTYLFDVPDAVLRPCRIVATQLSAGAWVDACSPEGTVRALTGLGGAVYLIGPAADALERPSDDRLEVLGCTDLPGLLRAAAEAGGVTVRLTCRDQLAVVVQGSAELATGRAGTWAMALDHTTGQWLVVEQGAALPCTPEPFCATFGPLDDLADAAAPIPRL